MKVAHGPGVNDDSLRTSRGVPCRVSGAHMLYTSGFVAGSAAERHCMWPTQTDHHQPTTKDDHWTRGKFHLSSKPNNRTSSDAGQLEVWSPALTRPRCASLRGCSTSLHLGFLVRITGRWAECLGPGRAGIQRCLCRPRSLGESPAALRLFLPCALLIPAPEGQVRLTVPFLKGR